MLFSTQQDLQSSVPDVHPTPDGESLHRECGPGVHGERRHVHGDRHQAGQADVAAEDEDLRRDGRGRLDPDTAGPRRHARHHSRYRETGATIPSSGTVSELDCYGILIVEAKHGYLNSSCYYALNAEFGKSHHREPRMGDITQGHKV